MENATGLGPAPAAAATPEARLSAGQARLLAQLRDAGRGVSLRELTELTGLHENTLRGHLDVLVTDGLVVKERRAAAGRGRPAWEYAAGPATGPESELTDLAISLASALAAGGTDPVAAAEAAGRSWGDRLARRLDVRGPDGVVSALRRLGFAPRISTGGDPALQVRLTRCPLLDAARAEPGIVCSVHQGLVHGLLRPGQGGSESPGEPTADADRDEVRLLPFAEPGACLLELAPGSPT